MLACPRHSGNAAHGIGFSGKHGRWNPGVWSLSRGVRKKYSLQIMWPNATLPLRFPEDAAMDGITGQGRES